MRTLALAALTMVTAFGASTADAQRLGGRGMPGASYPMPGSMPVMQQPGGGVPVNLPPPPMVNTNMPQRPYPGQMNPQRPYPANPQRPYPGQTYPGPRPVQGGGSQWGGSVGGHWSGGMNAPGGWNAYRRPSRGYRLPSYWVSPSFYIGDFGSYGLYSPPQGYGWQRYYDDAVLVDGRGRVRDSVYGLDWDGGYGGGDGYASGDYGYAYAQGGAGGAGYGQQYQPQYQQLPPVSHNGNVTTYSTSSGYTQGGYTQGGYAQGGYAAGGYYYPGATTTVVTIQGAPSVTTTTTEYIEETRTRYVAPRRVYHAPKRHYYRPRCSCRRAAPVEQPILGS